MPAPSGPPRRARSRWPTAGTCGTTCASTPARPSPATGSASAQLRLPGPAGDQRQQTSSRKEKKKEKEKEKEKAGCPLAWRPSSASGTPRCASCAPPAWTQDQTAAALGLSRQLTGRFWRAGSAEALLTTAGTSALDPFKPYLRRRWEEGITSIAALHREITARGYPGSELTTYRWLALLKLAAPPKPPAPPAKQQVTRWMLTDPAVLFFRDHEISGLRPAAAPSP